MLYVVLHLAHLLIKEVSYDYQNSMLMKNNIAFNK